MKEFLILCLAIAVLAGTSIALTLRAILGLNGVHV